ncbi:MAG: HNH endonuclease [Defluviitaleaceae bacterium]|nr:HNH endonuclease [Defluviitaleaceae bacterium]
MSSWNKAFYQSKQWLEVRKAYLISQHYVCERCEGIAKIVHHKVHLNLANANDPYTTLSHENLEALCQTCHNKEHHGKPRKLPYSFDSQGNIIYAPMQKINNMP